MVSSCVGFVPHNQEYGFEFSSFDYGTDKRLGIVGTFHNTDNIGQKSVG